MPTNALGIAWIMEQVQAGTATWDEALSLLREFIRQEGEGDVDRPLLKHIALAFSRFLHLAESIDPDDPKQRSRAHAELLKRLGLKKESKGRPKINADDAVDVALAVFERRLAGDSLEKAVKNVSEFGPEDDALAAGAMSETEIRKAWAAHKEEAAEMWRHRHGVALPPKRPSPAEERRITEILKPRRGRTRKVEK